MKRLDWGWRLPDGATIAARLEMPARLESVWVGSRLVSRSNPGGKADGHVVTLPGADGGAYRGGGEVRIVFDAFGDKLATCELTIDGRVIPPVRRPRPIRAFALPSLAGGGVTVFVLFIFVRPIFLEWARNYRPPPRALTAATASDMPEPTPSPDPTPASANDRVVAGLRPAFRRCYQIALNQEPSLAGRVVIQTHVADDGSVDNAWPVTSTLPTRVQTCVLDVVKQARFPPGNATTLNIPITFENQH